MQVQGFNIETLLLVCKRSRGRGFAGEVKVWFVRFFNSCNFLNHFINYFSVCGFIFSHI